MDIRPVLGDLRVGLFGLHALGGNGNIGYEQQRATCDFVIMTDDEQRRRFHVDGDTGHLGKLAHEVLVVLP